jgi:hypothetical protein
MIHSPPKFTKHSFIPPFRISEGEYQEIKSTPDYVKSVVKPDWKFFHANYTRQLLLWSVPLVVAWANVNFLLASLSEFSVIVLGLFALVAFNKSLQYGLSAYSLWEVIQKKQKFYKMVKSFVDRTGTYQTFTERFNNRNVR